MSVFQYFSSNGYGLYSTDFIMKHGAKTRQQIAEEYGISSKTLSRWIKKEKMKIESGLLTPDEQKIIYQKFGIPLIDNNTV